MPILQPNLAIKKSVNGPNDKQPIPVPAVTKPKTKHHNEKKLKIIHIIPFAIARFLSK